MERKERREKRKKEKKENAGKPTTIGTKLPTPTASAEQQTFAVGDTVRMRGLTTVGTVETVHTVKKPESTQPATFAISRETRQTIDSHKLNFHQDLDVRGMRGDEALNAVQHFIDDAILVGMSRVRILHGKGNGILRQLIRQYLLSVPNVTSCKDEHVQFGGAGITVVDF